MAGTNVDIRKVLIVDGVDDICKNVLQNAGIEAESYEKITREKLLSIVADFDALIVRSASKVDEEVIHAGKKLQIIGRAGTGVDNINVDAATARGIIVMNTPGGNTLSAAEHTCAMIAACARQIPQAHASMKQGKWERKNFMGVELFGKTLAILGLGRIGREVATRMIAYGMKVIGYDPILPAEVARSAGIEPMTLEQIWPLADFITVHTPLIESTRDLLRAETFAKCKKGVRVVNCARGGIISEKDLLQALISGQCAAAALDVYEEEPPKDIATNALIHHPNCIVTPHLGASTEEAQAKVAQEIAVQIVDATKNKEINGSVNAPALSSALKNEPWVTLGFKLGMLAAQLAEGSLQRLTVTAQGKTIQPLSTTLCSAVLVGLLNHLQTNPVNLINVRKISESLGINVHEERTTELDSEYQNVLTVRYLTNDNTELVFSGTVFGEKNIRFTRFNSFVFEVRLQGHMMFYRNIDRPGVVAAIGALLAKNNINIADLNLGRDDDKKEALCIVSTDQCIPAEVLVQIQQTSNIKNARLVSL